MITVDNIMKHYDGYNLISDKSMKNQWNRSLYGRDILIYTKSAGYIIEWLNHIARSVYLQHFILSLEKKVDLEIKNNAPVSIKT
ncbi:hypothetical protein ACJX0J_026775, partial [Zea mays]